MAEKQGRWASTLLLIAGLLAYANMAGWRYARRLAGPPTPETRNPKPETRLGEAVRASIDRGHMAVLAGSLLWAAAERIGPQELGVARRGLGRSLLAGLASGILGSGAIRLGFRLPPVQKRLVPPQEWTHLRGEELFGLFAGQLFLGSAVMEEIVFRGLLHAKLARHVGETKALLLGAAVFAGWHLAIVWFNLKRVGLPPSLFPVGYTAVLGVLFGVGAFFGLLRQTTGHVAGSIIAHWLLIASIVLSVMRPRRKE